MDYTQAGILEEMKTKLSLLSNWQRTLYSGVYERLFSVISYIIFKLVYVAEFLYRESNWSQAQKIESLMNKISFLNYTPYRKIGASGNILVTANAVASAGDFESNYTYEDETVVIPKYTRFTDTNNELNFYSTEAKTYFKDQVVKNQYMSGLATDQSAGLTGIPLADYGSGIIDLTEGDVVWIQGTDNYDGFYDIEALTTGRVDIRATFVTETFDGNETIISGLTQIPVREGEIKEYIHTASGDANEVITIFGDSIDNAGITVDIVDVNNVVLNEVDIVGIDTDDDKLYFIDDVDNYYCQIDTGSDFESVKFTFGDGVSVKKLEAGNRVRISYGETLGADGNVQNLNTVIAIKDTIVDVLGSEVTLYVTNKEELSNASDEEDIESIRNNAPNLFGTGYRCGGYADWIAILERHDYINKVKIWSTDDVADDTITTNQNKIYVVAIAEDGSALTASQQNTVTIDYLKDLKSPTEVVSWQPLSIVYLKAIVTSTVKTESFTVIQNQINSAIYDAYNITAVDFAEDIHESNATAIVDNLVNVVYNSIDIYHLEKDLDASTSAQTILVSKLGSEEADATKQILCTTGSFELWLELFTDGAWQSPIRIGYDDGLGTLLDDATNNYDLQGTLITYGANTITFTANGLTGLQKDIDYKLSMSYKTEDGNGAKINDIRFANAYTISDVDTDYITHIMTY